MRRACPRRAMGAASSLGLAFAVFAGLAVPGLGICPAAAAPSGVALDSLLRAEERAGFSGAVLVARGDSILFERAYGTARTSEPRAFWLASDSKQFTATAIMRLEETGRLRTTDSLGRFIARVPRDKAAITVHQLLTHTSGLPHGYRADGITDRDQAVEAILGLGLRGAPGAAYSYSNDGYTLLAAIVEIASRVPFDDYLADSLFARAGLGHTGLWGHEDARTPIAPLADPRRTRGMRPTIWRDGHSVGNWGYRGCTGAWATPGDVAAWLRALRAGRVIGPETLAKQLGRHILVRDDSTGQTFTAYGWSVRVEGGRDVSYGHTGSEDWLGHTSVIRFTPAGEVVVVLGNSGETDGTGWAMRVNRGIRRLADVATGAPP